MVEWLLGVDWGSVFLPQVSPIETIVRGSVMYLALFILLRVVLKRESGAMGITDLLVVVLIAEAAQNGMAAEYTSLPDGVLLVATIVFWAYALDWLSYRIPTVHRLLHPRALPLIKDSRLLRRNMQKELITEEELISQLRLQGVEEVSQVKDAYMESDGRISVIERAGGTQGAQERKLG